MATVTLKSLLEAGVHFGHRTKRWNPKMKPFIFTERNGVHIIDLQQTVSQLDRAYQYVQDLVAQGGTILFVGTKRQAADIIQSEAERCQMPYVNKRWLGGTLTNFRTIRSRVDYMTDLERRREYGEFRRLPKKEVLKLNQLIERLNVRVGGLRNLEELPSALFIVDIRREDLAVKEAAKLDIPIIAVVDTNCNPDPIDIVIPSNDDAIRAIKLMVGKMADAVVEGLNLREALAAEAEEERREAGEDVRPRPAYDRERTIDELLGPSTLAKLEEGIGSEEDEEEEQGRGRGRGKKAAAKAKAEVEETDEDEDEVEAEDEVEDEIEDEVEDEDEYEDEDEDEDDYEDEDDEDDDDYEDDDEDEYEDED